MKYFITCIVGLLCLGASMDSIAQNTIMDLKDMGDRAYEEGKYRKAVRYLEEFDQYKPQNLDVLRELGISYYHVNRLADALKSLLLVVNYDRHPDELLYFYIARTYHGLEQFNKAAEYYKKYIVQGSDEKLIEASKAHLIRCGNARKIINYDSRAYVDNMGSKVNSIFDEFYPVVSKSSSYKLYFSAETIPDSMQEEVKSYEQQPTDIYTIQVAQGIWQNKCFMNPRLNTDDSEILYGFSPSGQVAYYFTGKDRYFGYLCTDTFGIQAKEFKNIVHLPADPMYGDQDFQILNDSTIVFASIRDGGYGGYDLYIMHKTGDSWSIPRNLGPTINSPYNERSPYISSDFLTIIFSSDRPNSLGAYDFFTAEWNDESRRYINVENMGAPLNSAGNDIHFAMSIDRVTCFFSSDRKSGYGGYDLYTGYLKKQLSATQIPFPAVVSHVIQGPIETNNPDRITMEPRDVSISSVMYSDGNVMRPSTIKEYDKIADLMHTYPAIKLRIQVFSSTDLKKALDLYFSVKTGEQIANYLKNKGIDGNRIQITGCGSAYPLAVSRYIGGGHIPKGVNTRVDFYFTDTEMYPLTITYKLPKIPPDADQTAFKIFNSYNSGLSFRVQVASVGQKYSSPLIEEGENVLIHKLGDSGLYKYTMGLFTRYDKALQYRDKIRAMGIDGAFIVPYIHGMRLTHDELKASVNEYPELKAYLGTGDE